MDEEDQDRHFPVMEFSLSDTESTLFKDDVLDSPSHLQEFLLEFFNVKIIRS